MAIQRTIREGSAQGGLAVAFALMLALPWSGQQTASAQNRQARLLYEYYHFGGTCELAGVLSDLADELKRDVYARGLFVVYSGYANSHGRTQTPRGTFNRHALAIKAALQEEMDIDPRRVDVVDGGRRKVFTGQSWILPMGAQRPELTPDPNPPPYSDIDSPFDEYGFRGPYDSDTLVEFEWPQPRLEGFAKEIKSTSGVTGYIIGYGACNTTNAKRRHEEGLDKFVVVPARKCDRPGAGKRLADKEKHLLVNEFRVDSSRLVTVNGGFRDSNQIELWTIPDGARAPQSTPTAFPQKTKRAERR
jgi:hypothetical protein